MAIYGTALLSICLLLGLGVGQWIGLALGMEANVGGVGIAMVLLIVTSARMRDFGYLSQPTRNGVLFWSAIYIPIVVAMAASQDVSAAVAGGPAAIAAGTLAVVVCFAMVPLLGRFGRSDQEDLWQLDEADVSASENQP